MIARSGTERPARVLGPNRCTERPAPAVPGDDGVGPDGGEMPPVATEAVGEDRERLVASPGGAPGTQPDTGGYRARGTPAVDPPAPLG
jgi:hypothetical protein